MDFQKINLFTYFQSDFLRIFKLTFSHDKTWAIPFCSFQHTFWAHAVCEWSFLHELRETLDEKKYKDANLQTALIWAKPVYKWL